MKKLDCSEYIVHVNVCTNERLAPKTSCKAVGGHEFYSRVKQKLKDLGLNKTHRATRTGCLGFCNATGCSVAIHSKGHEPRWYTAVTDADFDLIWDEINSHE